METPTIEQVEIMSVSELLTNMASISASYQTDRDAYSAASDKYHKKYRRVRLFLTYGFLDRFENPDTLEFIQAKPQPVKLFEDDKTSLVEIECEAEFSEYKKWKHTCETADAAFEMFAKQLSFHQTKMRSEGAHDQMVREIDRQVNR